MIQLTECTEITHRVDLNVILHATYVTYRLVRL